MKLVNFCSTSTVVLKMSNSKLSASGGKKNENLRSAVWEYFNRSSNLATCLLCKSTLKADGGSTKSLHTHLKSKHNISCLKRGATQGGENDDEECNDNDVSVKSKTQDKFGACSMTVSKYFIGAAKFNSLSATVSRLTSCDGLPFHVFASSPDLRRVMASSGYELPRSHNAVRGLVISHAGEIRMQVMDELKKLKSENQRFSLTFDEWTSNQNRRYMVINVHRNGPKFWSLGLVRVHGSMPAERCIELIKKKLQSFGLDLESDIVGICTDGASVMCKVGKLISGEHQLCYAHGIHLAVQDVLYKKVNTSGSEVDAGIESGLSLDQQENESGGGISNEYDEDTLEAAVESEDDCDNNENDSGVNFEVDVCQSIAELSPQYRTTIKKVRNIVKMFRKSPTKNDSVLQKYVKEDKGQELALILDCPTRWNSLISMLNRFSLLKTAIQKALIDLKIPTSSDLHATDADFTLVDEMIRTLEPVALAVTVLSRRDVNLITAEAALQFCVTQLEKQTSQLPKTMAMALRERISARYADHSYVLRYLHNGDASSEFGKNELSTTAIKKFICRLLVRLDCKPRLASLTNSSTSSTRQEEDAQGQESAPTASCSTSTATFTGKQPIPRYKLQFYDLLTSFYFPHLQVSLTWELGSNFFSRFS